MENVCKNLKIIDYIDKTIHNNYFQFIMGLTGLKPNLLVNLPSFITIPLAINYSG